MNQMTTSKYKNPSELNYEAKIIEDYIYMCIC